MADEKKTYPSHPVTIETAEYRDLIVENAELTHELEDYRRKFWKEQTEKEAVQKELTTAKANLEKFTAFINSSEEIKGQFESFLAKRALNGTGFAAQPNL